MTDPDARHPTPAFPLWNTDTITTLGRLPNWDVGSTSYLGNTPNWKLQNQDNWKTWWPDCDIFGMPSGIHLPQFDGSGWSNWSRILEAILTLHEAEDVLLSESCPSSVNQDKWNSIQQHTKAYLHLYVKQDIYSLIASDLELPSFKHKWDKLKNTYGGASGSTTVFNMWIQLIQA